MAATKYSLAKEGNKPLSANFRVGEFRCKDNSDEVLIDNELVRILQQIRNYFNKPVIIISAYRHQRYNTSIGGAKQSQHLFGTAADIRIDGIKPRLIAEYAESIMPNKGGIGLYEYSPSAGKPGFVHVDVRVNRSRWLQKSPNGGATNVSGFNSTITTGKTKLWLGCEGAEVKELQKKLAKKGFYKGLINGVFDIATEAAVKAFQTANKIKVDGVVGKQTGALL